jgi:hypothetical protein
LVIGTINLIDEDYYSETHCYKSKCCYSNAVSEYVYFHNRYDGKGYVFNSRTEEKTVKNVEWIVEPYGKDSLVCFSDGKKRGYFNKNTGKVVVEPKYDHAWVFSDGLACVEENGYLKFIDATGKVVIDKISNGGATEPLAYSHGMDACVFHGGYCIINTGDDDQCGLIDKTGKIVLPRKYSSIELTNDFEQWILRKGREMAVIDKNLNFVVPFLEGSIYISEGTIDVTMKTNHTMRKYTLQGELINDFYIASVRMLEYEKDEFRYDLSEYGDTDNIRQEVSAYHPRATARLRAYVAGEGYEGLMTADGHLVTMPLYKDIEAIGSDLYVCTSTNCDKVIVNGKGEIVR